MGVQQLLLLGQLVVVVLVYLFVWRVLRTARNDLLGTGAGAAASGAAQESTIIPAADVARARRQAGISEPRLVVERSDVLRRGVPFRLANGLTLGRGDENDIVLDESHVSGAHARIVPPATLVDLGSTNGTFVNGQRISGRRPLRPGDQVQVGSTVLRMEAPR